MGTGDKSARKREGKSTTAIDSDRKTSGDGRRKGWQGGYLTHAELKLSSVLG